MMTCVGWHDRLPKIGPVGLKKKMFFSSLQTTSSQTHLTKTQTHALLPRLVFISAVLLLSRYWMGPLSSCVVDTLFANSSSASLSVKKTMRHEWERGRSQLSGPQRLALGSSEGGVGQLTGGWGGALGIGAGRKPVRWWSMWPWRRD